MDNPRFKKVNPSQGFNKYTGIEVMEWEDGRAVAALTLSDNSLNPAGLVHGGAVMSLLDVALALTGSYEEPPLMLVPGLTLSMNTSFISAVDATDGKLTATARKTGGGKSVFFSEGEVRADDGRLIASATGVFKRGRQPE